MKIREKTMIKIALTRLDSGRHDPAGFERDREEFLAPLKNALGYK